MKYGITVCTVDRWPIVEITEREFGAIKRAKACLLTLLSVEEKFDAVLENYAEYEREQLSMALDRMVHRGPTTWSTDVAAIFRINRRVVNLLTMTRLYADQVKHDLHTTLDAREHTWIEPFRAEYDAHFAYRLMEALRNHIQHNGLPVNAIKYPSSWEQRGDDSMAVHRFGVRPQLDTQQLCDNPKFKASVREEIQQCRDHPPLNQLVRQYVESFSRIHDSVRGLLREPAPEWRRVFLSAFERTASALPGRTHVDIIRFVNEREFLERVAVVRDLLDRIRELEGRNTLLPTLSRWYISSEICRADAG